VLSDTDTGIATGPVLPVSCTKIRNYKDTGTDPKAQYRYRKLKAPQFADRVELCFNILFSIFNSFHAQKMHFIITNRVLLLTIFCVFWLPNFSAGTPEAHGIDEAVDSSSSQSLWRPNCKCERATLCILFLQPSNQLLRSHANFAASLVRVLRQKYTVVRKKQNSLVKTLFLNKLKTAKYPS
jgi:hypothetical protein